MNKKKKRKTCDPKVKSENLFGNTSLDRKVVGVMVV